MKNTTFSSMSSLQSFWIVVVKVTMLVHNFAECLSGRYLLKYRTLVC